MKCKLLLFLLLLQVNCLNYYYYLFVSGQTVVSLPTFLSPITTITVSFNTTQSYDFAIDSSLQFFFLSANVTAEKVNMRTQILNDSTGSSLTGADSVLVPNFPQYQYILYDARSVLFPASYISTTTPSSLSSRLDQI